MSASNLGSPGRTEHETQFTYILRRVVEATDGALGAILVDAEGESVDYASAILDPFEFKVTAAHFQLLLQHLAAGGLTGCAGEPYRLVVQTDQRGFVVDALPDGYALCMVLDPEAGFGHANRALDEALPELYREAGWVAPPRHWHAVDVRVGEGGYPAAVQTTVGWLSLDIVGRVAVGLRAGEVGFRVGLVQVDCEFTLTLGHDGRWYADVAPATIAAATQVTRQGAP